MADRLTLLWFRHDLRLADHAALTAAVAAGKSVVPLFVLDDKVQGAWPAGGASRWWLHHSLDRLAQSLRDVGSRLILRRGATVEIIADIATEVGAGAVYCSRSYEPWARALELALRDRLAKSEVELKRFSGTLLHEPDQLTTQAGGPFKVYTPFWRALSGSLGPQRALAAPSHVPFPKKKIASDTLASWKLLPHRPDWAGGLRDMWQPGEDGARQRLKAFIDACLGDYATQRERPDVDGTSRLSPHLHFGEISPRQCWQAASVRGGAGGDAKSKGLETFLKELVWREFSAHLLFHWPDLPEAPFRPEFGRFPWRNDATRERAWQKGKTGFPIVDAGMRQLWTTGWMHNRVRMIVASFLIKDLLVPWQKGEAWFWDTLVDADLASNAASWQWVAGSGADAAPYFRIFNPVKQGQTFDPDGAYVRRWVPELAQLPAVDVHAPWLAHAGVLAAAGVVLGKSYPYPIVDHAERRDAALAAYKEIKVA